MISLDKQERYRQLYKKLKPGYRTSGQIYESLVASHIASETRVLDAGCGRVGVLNLFKDKAGLAVGLDAALSSLRDNLGLDHLVAGDLKAMPFADGSFDLVISSWVIEHLKAPDAAFAEIARILRHGGYFVFLTPNAWNYVVLLGRLIPTWLQCRLVPRVYGRSEADTFPVAYRANTKGRLDEKLGQVGLQCEEFHYIGDPSYIAFNSFFFRLGMLIERLTTLRPLRALKVHLVASYVKD